jgi:molybdopterin-guanine dinucleotide biosynthesis protein A
MADGKNITAIILAGGKSSRMGTDKAFVLFRGKKLIEHAIDIASEVTHSIIVVSRHAGYEMPGVTIVNDILPGCGPLGGLHAGLSASATDWNLLLGCDMPFITRDFLSFFLAATRESDALVPVHNGMPEPLCALYHKSCLPVIESLLLKNEFKMQNAVKKMNAGFIPVPENKFDASMLFRNFNSPEDMKAG